MKPPSLKNEFSNELAFVMDAINESIPTGPVLDLEKQIDTARKNLINAPPMEVTLDDE